MSPALETEGLFELSLAIDAGDGLQPMLRRFLSDMLRLLNGSGGAILLKSGTLTAEEMAIMKTPCRAESGGLAGSRRGQRPIRYRLPQPGLR